MVCEEIISEVNSLLPNAVDDKQKYKWLSNAERYVRGILSGYEGYESLSEDMRELSPETDGRTELSAKEPYSEMYTYYILAEINLLYGDVSKYNNFSVLYENVAEKFKCHCVRTYRLNSKIRSFKVI